LPLLLTLRLPGRRTRPTSTRSQSCCHRRSTRPFCFRATSPGSHSWLWHDWRSPRDRPP